MKKHATSIKGFDKLKDAAQEIGRMRYDALGQFLFHLQTELREQRDKDIEAEKTKLAFHSGPLISGLLKASDAASGLFYKYRKYMKDEIDDNEFGSY